MYSSKLLEETQRLWRLRGKEVLLRDVAAATGLSIRWLIHFTQNSSKAPAVDKVETLYIYLTGKQINLD